jgi:hypothetical protein
MSADALIIALVEQLVRKGALNADDVDAMAERLDGEGEDEAAHWARAALVQAMATPASEWSADQARSRFRIVTSDGGNRED